ncbi:UNC93-like protein [Trichonephila clavipes]|nr:UNC93-like protein [Trichonephila clavipes]
MKTANGHPEKLEIQHGDSKSDSTSAAKSKTHVMSKKRILKNLAIVCLGYFCLFSAYQALANLQSTLNTEDNIGVISQSIIYAALIFSSLFLPKLIIRKFGCKVTLVLSALTYAPFIAANFYPAMATLAPTSIFVGLGAAPLWSAKCTYLNEISVFYADQTSDTADIVTSRFFGIFFMVFQNTQIWGNLVSYFVLKPSRHASEELLNFTSITTLAINDSSDLTTNEVVCGAAFCSGMNENLMPPTEDKRYMLVGIFLALAILAAVTFGLFLDPIKQKKQDDNESITSRVVATLKHLKKTEQILLVPLTIYSGIQQAFILSDYSKAYVACAWGVYHVGLVFIFFGIVNAIMSFFAGHLIKYVSRMTLMLAGAAGNIGVCIVLFLWEPNSDQFVVLFFLAGMWGLSDGVWQTQLNAYYGVLFRSQEEAAFANYRLWESFGFALAFFYSTFLCIIPKISILLSFLIVGILGYVMVEIRSSQKKTTSDTSAT